MDDNITKFDYRVWRPEHLIDLADSMPFLWKSDASALRVVKKVCVHTRVCLCAFVFVRVCKGMGGRVRVFLHFDRRADKPDANHC